MLEEIENFFSLKQKEIGKVIEYRDLSNKMFLIEYHEKELYLFIEKASEDAIKITVIEFDYENKEKATAQTSKIYSVTRKFSEFKQESIFSVYHSIDEIMKILNELISNGKFIIYNETLDLAHFNSTHNSSQINKESYIYINEMNSDNNNTTNKRNRNGIHFPDSYDSPRGSKLGLKSKEANRENKKENSKNNNVEKEIKNLSPFKIFNRNKTNNFNNNFKSNNPNNIKIFFRLALLNRILISNIELEIKETCLNKPCESSVNDKNNGSDVNSINTKNNDIDYLTYVMNIIRILRNRTYEKNADLGKNSDTRDRVSVNNTIRLGNDTCLSNKISNNYLKDKLNYEDSEGEETRKHGIYLNTNTENGSLSSSPIKNLLINSKNKRKNQGMLSSDGKNPDLFRKSIFNGEKNQYYAGIFNVLYFIILNYKLKFNILSVFVKI